MYEQCDSPDKIARQQDALQFGTLTYRYHLGKHQQEERFNIQEAPSSILNDHTDCAHSKLHRLPDLLMDAERPQYVPTIRLQLSL